MADSQDSLGDSAVLSSLTIGAHMTVVLRLTPLSVGSVVFISFALTSHAQSQSQGPAPTPVASSGSAHVIAPAPALGPGPLSDAMALYRKGDFDSAIQKYRDVLQSDPKPPVRMPG